jgi:hypothetical protein
MLSYFSRFDGYCWQNGGCARLILKINTLTCFESYKIREINIQEL